METEQSRRLQNDGGTKNARRVHEKGAQAGDDTVPGAEVRRTLAAAAAIENQQLMPNQRGFGDNATESRIPAIVSASKTHQIQPIW